MGLNIFFMLCSLGLWICMVIKSRRNKKLMMRNLLICLAVIGFWAFYFTGVPTRQECGLTGAAIGFYAFIYGRG